MNQKHSNSSQNEILQDESEISLLDILRFLKRAWKTIVITSVLGLLVSGAYLFIAPAQYEAVTTIPMARVPSLNNVLGANVEEPPALIARMSLPGALNNEVMSSCGFESGAPDAALLAKSIKLSIPKGLTSVVELKVNRPTQELAKACATSVRQFIIASQEKMLSTLGELSGDNNKARLVIIEERISQDKALLAKAEQPRGPLTPTYFAVLSEIRALEDEKTKIMVALNFSKTQKETVTQSLIEVASFPVYPKRFLSLVAGLTGGLFLGLLIALARQVIAKLKSEAGGAL